MMNIRVKKLIFSLFTLVFPFVFLLILELILRFTVPYNDESIVEVVKYDGVEWYQVNRSYLKKFFPNQAQLIPEFKPNLFKKDKNPNIFRILCLGGSSMFGTPYQMTSNIPGIVRRQLRHIFPDREIEVINLAASAINSQVIKRLIPDLDVFEPDLVLIYMGHNEFYGPDGVGATTLEKNIPFILDLKYILREIRIYQILRNWITSPAPPQKVSDEKNLMREVSRGSLVELDSDDAKRIYRDFSANLGNIVSQFKKKNIPLIVSDVISNLEFAPFSYPPKIGEVDVDNIMEEIERQFAREEYPLALEHLIKLHRQDAQHALINFWMGKCFLAEGESDSALRYLILARDYDLLKFRAPSRINHIIEEICQQENLPFVSTASYFSRNSKNGIAGFDLFWEHLHPNTAGYYSIAELFTQRILEMEILRTHREKLFLPLHMDSLNICWLDLAYADISIQNLTGKWPFRNFAVSTIYLDSASPEIFQIVSDVYQRKIVWDDACYRSAAWFEKTGEFDLARNTYEAILEEYPLNFYAHYQLARLYRDLLRFDTAVKHYQISIESNPDYLFARLDLGMILINQGLFDMAIEHLKKALVLNSNQPNAAIEANINYGLSAAYANKRDLETAMVYVDRALEIIPNYPAARELKQGLMRAFQKNSAVR